MDIVRLRESLEVIKNFRQDMSSLWGKEIKAIPIELEPLPSDDDEMAEQLLFRRCMVALDQVRSILIPGGFHSAPLSKEQVEVHKKRWQERMERGRERHSGQRPKV